MIPTKFPKPHIPQKAEFGSEGILSVLHVSQLLDKTPNTIKRWADEGVFRWMRHHDGSRGIDRGDVEDYLRNSQQ